MMAPVHLVFSLYFAEIITLLVMETNRYYHGHLDRIDNIPLPLTDLNEAEMLVFLAITIQMGHCIRDKLTDYWATTNQFHARFYSSTYYEMGQIPSHPLLSTLQTTIMSLT